MHRLKLNRFLNRKLFNLFKSDKVQILVRNGSNLSCILYHYSNFINIQISARKSLLNRIKMQQKSIPKHKIVVRPPVLKPKITNIGYGNPRYNSMISYKDDTILLPCGSSLRLVNLKNNQILYAAQIGHSQIFQIAQNSKYILVVNFQGLLTLLGRQTLQIKHQLHAPGKQIRHLSFTDHRLVISCELSQLEHITKFCVYKISDLQKGKQQPAFMKTGHFYFPQQIQSNNDIIAIQYQDPNPKGRSRTQTVLLQKKPIKHRIVRFTQHENQLKQEQIFLIQQKGQIICAASNKDTIYYLHPSRKITVFCNSMNMSIQTALPGKSSPIMIQKYKQGIIWSSATNQLTYTRLDKQKLELVSTQIAIKSLGVGGNLSIKPIKQDKGFFLFNQNGIHHYCSNQNITYSQSEFQITNCGLTMNADGSLIAVGDFAGNVSILQTHNKTIVPKALTKINVGMPIRSLAWCHKKNIIVIGCVGGGIYAWNINDSEPIFIDQINHTINIIRYAHEKIFLGTSDGQVKILDEQSLSLLYQYKAHHPINYETKQQQQLFGSMKNYAEIWSLTISPQIHKNQYSIISSSQDQTQKIFKIKQDKQHEQTNHLKGHQLAVTSIDWKVMGKDLGQVYVSCSDDKRVRFRNPKKDFQIMYQLQTNTIKQWHTLTYLALQQNGTRVAIGSQNGYLFIFDLQTKQLIFGQKIHLGGVQGLDWRNNKIITCSSDLCISVLDLS